MFMEFADKLQFSLRICGFYKIKDSAYSYAFSAFLLHTYFITCLWIPQIVPDSANFVEDFTKLADSAGILSNTVI